VRIALLSPLYESVPPRCYGGTERVVWWLTEELERRGHDVTLFCSGDSRTSANQVPLVEQSLRLHGGQLLDPVATHLAAARIVRDRAHEFDIVHSNIDYLAFPSFIDCPVPHIHTMHGRLDVDGLSTMHAAYPVPLVSISDSQRAPIPDANWIDTVYHGLPTDLYRAGQGRGDFVLFLGRISPEKRPCAAIEIARKAGVKLVMAAKIDVNDRKYYREVVEPLLLDGGGVEFIGEVDDAEKIKLLGECRALLNPVLWPEPFGLVMIEAMACGAPVLGRCCGSVPEVVRHGVTGAICDDDEALVEALGDLDRFDRAACRRHVEEHFSVAAMTEGYLAVYEHMIELARMPAVTSRPAPRRRPLAGSR
jgi:glycosyltransferase involved in cell wall biosynthesis